MEFFGIIILIGIVGLAFWLFGKLIHLGWVFVTLPIKFLFFLLSAGLFLLFIPLGVLAGVIGLILPLILVVFLLPFLLIGMFVRISQR